MKAMILAAGLGTRLRPLTNDRPKALVRVGGQTMLELAIERLRGIGVRDIVINVHHFADMVLEYLEANENFGMHIEVSAEQELLDTGGGLKKASEFLLANAGSIEESFILHNVDVISTIDLNRMIRAHTDNEALATLAVQKRETARYLLFDEELQLCGRRFPRENRTELVRPSNEVNPLAFSGIHVVSLRLLPMLAEDGCFSIIESYLRLSAGTERIMAFRADEYYWRDLGTPENVRLAEQEMTERDRNQQVRGPNA